MAVIEAAMVAVSSSVPALKASNNDEMIDSSISAPLNVSLSRANCARSNVLGSRPRLAR